MKNKRRRIWPVIWTLTGALLVAAVGLTFFFHQIAFYIEAGALLVLAVVIVWQLRSLQKEQARYLTRIARHLNQTEQDSLEGSPLPVVVASEQDEIVWYNDRFRKQVLDGAEVFGSPIGAVCGGLSARELAKAASPDIRFGKRRYTVMVSPVCVRDKKLYVLYYIDNTSLKEIAEEYEASRPAVMVVYIDNLDELMQDTRDSERAQMAGKIETLLEDWIGSTTGILRKSGTDRYLIVLEQRHMERIVQARFDILDRVRRVQCGERAGVTLSIGVGQGETLRESETMARQALEMALGRGGDQAALKTKNGFDFYGGASKGVERRTKVRTRVIASALQELLDSSEKVFVMGHRFSDLDCLGSAVALASVARGAGKIAYVVVQREKTLAPELLERYDRAHKADWFIEPEDALELMDRRSLLVITDTHNPRMLESLPVYQKAQTVVVIDHHRKMVEHIDNAVIFYHEPYASSASEMVAELVQYMGRKEDVTRLEAEALLAGIMLDTRGFVMKAGVRTFEAAAHLRRLGADTVEAKRLFSGSMALHQRKSDIVTRAQLYRCTAMAVADGGGPETRVAASQAADELLSVKGVEASFVLFEDNGEVNISARSLGEFNVQLVMEALGGGGHLTMAGAQMKGLHIEEGYQRLTAAVDAYLAEREHSLAAQRQPEEG